MRGQLLIAGPGLTDPNFHRAVVLMLEHSDEGALGVILNRPTEIDLADHLPGWSRLAADPQVVFVGGPVEQGGVLALGRADTEEPIDGFVPLLDTIGVVDLDQDPDAVDAIDDVRAFTGYAGWGPGQLEAEIAEGGWLQGQADPAEALAGQPADLWRRVVARLPAPLNRLRHYPDHVSNN